MGFRGSLYSWGNGGRGGALDLHDTPFAGAEDLGNPDRTAWSAATRTYLKAHPDTNVIMWSWCGQVSWSTEKEIASYLTQMSSLEKDFPKVKFVYMTGHLDGTGVKENLHQRDEQIRKYCRQNGKFLYDFADIESYNPDGVYFADKLANDACEYDSNGDGSLDKNWAEHWQKAHVKGTDWFECESAHSQAVNANRKAYAACTLWARLAGWDGVEVTARVGK